MLATSWGVLFCREYRAGVHTDGNRPSRASRAAPALARRGTREAAVRHTYVIDVNYNYDAGELTCYYQSVLATLYQGINWLFCAVRCAGATLFGF